MTKSNSPITTHVLDVSRGKPAADVPVTLERQTADGWETLAKARSDSDGRVVALFPSDRKLQPDTYRITFGVGHYFSSLSIEHFYPDVSVVFFVKSPDEHYHVPLLVSPHGYSTYRGS